LDLIKVSMRKRGSHATLPAEESSSSQRKITQAKKNGHADRRGSKSGSDNEDLSDDNGDDEPNPAMQSPFMQIEAMDEIVAALHGRMRTTEMQLHQTRREVCVLRQREEQRDTFLPELITYGVGLERRKCDFIHE
jgi:hypothetical protein